MINLLLIAEAAAEDFTSPGYSSGTELPPVPVDNTVGEVPINASSFNSEYMVLIIAIILLILAIIVITTIIIAVRKNRNVSDLAGFEEEFIESEPEKVKIPEKPVFQKSPGSKLSTPQNLKTSIKNFLERTQNL